MYYVYMVANRWKTTLYTGVTNGMIWPRIGMKTTRPRPIQGVLRRLRGSG